MNKSIPIRTSHIINKHKYHKPITDSNKMKRYKFSYLKSCSNYKHHKDKAYYKEMYLERLYACNWCNARAFCTSCLPEAKFTKCRSCRFVICQYCISRDIITKCNLCQKGICEFSRHCHFNSRCSYCQKTNIHIIKNGMCCQCYKPTQEYIDQQLNEISGILSNILCDPSAIVLDYWLEDYDDSEFYEE
jgi:hypothetical protein